MSARQEGRPWYSWCSPLRSSTSASVAPNAAKARVAGGGVRLNRVARRHPVAAAVGVVAEVGAAAGRPARAADRALRVGALVARVEVPAEPVGAPLPHVPGDVVEPVVVGRERVDGAGAEEPVREHVVPWELALPHVHAVLAPRLELVAPREHHALEAAARGVFPLGLGG